MYTPPPAKRVQHYQWQVRINVSPIKRGGQPIALETGPKRDNLVDAIEDAIYTAHMWVLNWQLNGTSAVPPAFSYSIERHESDMSCRTMTSDLSQPYYRLIRGLLHFLNDQNNQTLAKAFG